MGVRLHKLAGILLSVCHAFAWSAQASQLPLAKQVSRAAQNHIKTHKKHLHDWKNHTTISGA
jgi:hypothetical protein